MFKRLIDYIKRNRYFAATLFVLLFLAVVANSARAMTILGNPQSCYGLAMMSAQMVEYRDGGISWDIAAVKLAAEIQEAKGQPDVWVVDDDDAELTFKTFAMVWDNVAKDASMIAEEVYTACMAPAKNRI